MGTDAPKQTVAQLQVAHWNSPLDFFLSIPQSLEFNIMWMLCLAGVVGAAASYIYKWANGYTTVGFLDYFFRSNAKRSVLTGIAFFATIFSGTALGAFVNDGVFVGWLNVLWVGVTTGFTVDAGFNKSNKADTGPVPVLQPMPTPAPETPRP